MVGNGWAPAGLPDGVRGVGAARGRRHPGGPQRRRRGTCAASCCSSSTTTRSLRRPRRARARRRRSSTPIRRSAPLQLRVAPRDGGAPLARLGAAAARRRPRALERRHGRVGGRGGDAARACSSASAAGRTSSASCTRASTSPGGCWTPASGSHYAGDIVALHPRRRRAPAARLLGLLRRPQPRLARPPPPAAAARPCSTSLSFAVRTLPLLRSRGACRAALRGYRDGLRGPMRPRRPLRARTLWRMTQGRPPTGHLATSLIARVDEHPPTVDARRRRARERVHGRARTSTSPTRRPAAAACRTCASCGAGASSRVELSRTEPARPALRHRVRAAVAGAEPAAAGAASTSCWSTSCATGKHADRLLRPPDGRAVRLLLRLGSRSARREVGRQGRQADPQHARSRACCCRSRR